MGKHFFHETDYRSGYSEYHRLIYCEWCGIVVWNFNANNRTTPTLEWYQSQAGDVCKANLMDERTPDLSGASKPAPLTRKEGRHGHQN